MHVWGRWYDGIGMCFGNMVMSCYAEFNSTLGRLNTQRLTNPLWLLIKSEVYSSGYEIGVSVPRPYWHVIHAQLRPFSLGLRLCFDVSSNHNVHVTYFILRLCSSLRVWPGVQSMVPTSYWHILYITGTLLVYYWYGTLLVHYITGLVHYWYITGVLCLAVLIMKGLDALSTEESVSCVSLFKLSGPVVLCLGLSTHVIWWQSLEG